MILRFPGGLRKALTLSYDDGVEQDAALITLMNQHGLKGTFNLNSGLFAPEGTVYPAGTIHRRMREAQVLALYGQGGHEVAVHGATHPVWTELPDPSLTRDILEDRAKLEALFGCLVRGAASPYGRQDARVETALALSGLVYCRTTESSHGFDIPGSWLHLRPTCHHGDPALPELCQRFLADAAAWSSRLFYLWGHSYEFERDDNWHIMEDFCHLMGGRDDIWYATNIEIYDYVAAYRQLRVSADGQMVHNPTAVTLWVEEKGQLRQLLPGETSRFTP